MNWSSVAEIWSTTIQRVLQRRGQQRQKPLFREQALDHWER
jgi:hypothetical protein